MFIYENGGFRKRFPEWRLLKTQVYRFSVDGKNGAFQNAYVTTNASPENIAGAIGACVSNRKKRPSRGLMFFSSECVRSKTLVWTQSFLSVFG